MRPWGYLVVSVLGVLGTCIAMPAFGAGQAAAVDAQRLKNADQDQTIEYARRARD